jgi:hypothetical protein
MRQFTYTVNGQPTAGFVVTVCRGYKGFAVDLKDVRAF